MIVLAPVFALSSEAVHGWLGTHPALVEFWSDTKTLWSLTTALLVLEFAAYWRHRLQHIRDEKLMGSNFSNTFTFWDRVFGTYVDPKPYLGCETGIAEGTRGIFGELARPFALWFGAQQPVRPRASQE